MVARSTDECGSKSACRRGAPGGGVAPVDLVQIAFVLYPGLTLLDLIGPLQTLAPLPRIDATFEVVVVAENTDVHPTGAVIKLAPSHIFDEARSPFAIVVPGGGQPPSPRAATGD